MSEPDASRSARARSLPPWPLTAGIGLYAFAMAYLEAAVVIYLRISLDVGVGDVFPIDLRAETNVNGLIELGREAATLVMIASVGWLAGRTWLERLAWASVVFGVWDIGYYVWLWVLSGWPSSVLTWDLLFLLPLPWAGPVWAPVAVSMALIGFGLVCAGRLRAGADVVLGPRRFALLLAGGFIIIVSFLLNAGVVLAGETPSTFAWPVFAAGMAIGMAAAADALRSSGWRRDPEHA